MYKPKRHNNSRTPKYMTIQDGVATITIMRNNGRTYNILVDAEDLKRFDWRNVHITGNNHNPGNEYARVDIWDGDVRTRVRLHRFITNAPEGLEPDHVNMNKLDNRKVNLELVTHYENCKRFWRFVHGEAA